LRGGFRYDIRSYQRNGVDPRRIAKVGFPIHPANFFDGLKVRLGARLCENAQELRAHSIVFSIVSAR